MAKLQGTGTGDKRKVAIAAALGVVVLVLAFHTIFGGPAPTAPAVVAPAAVPARQATTARGTAALDGQSAGVADYSPSSTDPTLHPELMAENENYLYQGSGRNIFSQTAGTPLPTSIRIPKALGPARPNPGLVQTAVSGPPPPPAIDLRFFGYAARHNGTRRAFLLHGDDVFVASEGDVVSHRYRVVRIAPNSIEIEDLPYHNTQTLPLVVVPTQPNQASNGGAGD